MPTLEIAASDAGPAVAVEASGRLLDACDEARAPVAFSCRGADCGTCRVEILTGGDLLEPAREDEREVLGKLASAANHRLACQVVVRPIAGLVRLRWVGARVGRRE